MNQYNAILIRGSEGEVIAVNIYDFKDGRPHKKIKHENEIYILSSSVTDTLFVYILGDKQ